MRHRLSSITEWARIAYCSQCSDTVSISKCGKGWICAVSMKESKILSKYGRAALDAWLEHNGCELCGDEDNLNIDHCGTTNTFRGILCSKHNRGLSMFNHDPALLRKAAEYLEGGVGGKHNPRMD